MVMILDKGGAYMTIPHFAAGAALELLGREKATIAYPSVVTIMQALITHPTFHATDLASRSVMTSNSAAPPACLPHAVTPRMHHTIQIGTHRPPEAAAPVSTTP